MFIKKNDIFNILKCQFITGVASHLSILMEAPVAQLLLGRALRPHATGPSGSSAWRHLRIWDQIFAVNFKAPEKMDKNGTEITEIV